jgi:NifU-like protein involved in Fe-S cluster formation
MSRPSATVLDHALSPRNGGAMEQPDAVGRASLGGNAPYVTIYLKIDQDRVTKAMFQTYGCGFSIACCSVLTEMVTGITLAECCQLGAASLIETLAGLPEEKHFCAQLAIDGLGQALISLMPASDPAK